MKKIDYAAMFTLRKDGRYMGWWRDAAGKRLAVYDRDPEHLYQKLATMTDPAPQEPSFKAVAELWQVEHVEKLSLHTQHDYRHKIAVLSDRYDNVALKDVGPADVNQHLMQLAGQGMSAKTVRGYRSVYKQIFDFAIVRGLVQMNPVASVHTPRGLPRKTRDAPSDDVIRLIKARADDAHFGLFPLFLIYTGFRRAEALAVQWQDVDFEGKTICCNKTLVQVDNNVYLKEEPKTKAGNRTVPLLDGLAKHLKRPAGAKATDFIFSGAEPWNDSRYRQEWLGWCRDVGLVERREEKRGKKKDGTPRVTVAEHPTLTAHQLRHGYATVLFEAGVDELTAKELLGHADIQTTHAIYTHIRQGKRDEATAALNEQFNSI